MTRTSTAPLEPALIPPHREMLKRYREVRATTLTLAAPLSPEDQMVQSMPDASPTKWHLAHTTWFFETFVLSAHVRDYVPFDARYKFLFNSYYKQLGGHPHRAMRGILSRPGLDEILCYRHYVDNHIQMLFDREVSS